jgi:cytochrome c peroxidase
VQAREITAHFVQVRELAKPNNPAPLAADDPRGNSHRPHAFPQLLEVAMRKILVPAFVTNWSRKSLVLTSVLCFFGIASAAIIPRFMFFFDPVGLMGVYNVNGRSSTSNPFFQVLGTNGRTCSTCHVTQNAFGLSAEHAERVFDRTRGRDPLFAPFDGAACPDATSAHPLNFDLLRHYGLIRIGLQLAANPQFTITAVHDPYGCAMVTDPGTGVVTLSVYRRPLPATNLGFLTAVQFDGRETVAPLNDPQTFAANLVTDLKHQALDATLGHAQASVTPSDTQLMQIVQFEMAMISAQAVDLRAGRLDTKDTSGGPMFLSDVPFYPGINDPLGGNPTGAAFDPNAFTLYSQWINSPDPYRRSVARGEEVFNTHPLLITDVRGLNDALHQTVINGTCSTCHDTPNVGDHSLPVPLEIGTSRSADYETNQQIQSAVSQLSMPVLPVFEIVCKDGPDAGEITYTSDPGKATLSGKCADVGRGKGPILRGLAARAPYFHNGAAATLNQVVDFYNLRFQMNLTEPEKLDLVNFLKTL